MLSQEVEPKRSGHVEQNKPGPRSELCFRRVFSQNGGEGVSIPLPIWGLGLEREATPVTEHFTDL